MTDQSTALAQPRQFDLSPQTFEQALKFSEMLADSDLVPKDFKNKPANCLIAMQWGSELGLKPLQALQNLAVINGRPALWGDAVIALVRSNALCEYVNESQTDHSATCRVKRRGEPEQERTFTMADAQAAGLKGKQGPWTQYPKRMMQMRARAFALRDVFPDVLRGMAVAEELIDTQKDMGVAEDITPPRRREPEASAGLPPYSNDKFAENLPKWTEAIAGGRATADKLIAKIETVGVMTDEQKATLRALPKSQPTDVTPKNETQTENQE